jgi:ubiquinone/menaquinone biosynthesis C-methylase UbiE
MPVPPSSYNPRRFRTTVPFYLRYRLGYPESLIARVIDLVGLKPGDPIMDLGCGPGLLAIPFARAGMCVTAVDPEPAMLEAAAAAAREAGVQVAFREGSSFALPMDAAPFRLVTMGRAFHWMDGANTLAALDPVVTKDGALAFFDDDHPATAENSWRVALRELGNKYGREQSPHLVRARSPGFRTHHALLLDSPFSRLEGLSEFIRRELSADDIVGRAFSTSTSSPERLGDRAEAFETELRAALTALSPEGRFVEIAELAALVARRPCL